MDNTLSNILFTEPVNKSDQTGLNQQEGFPKEEKKVLNEQMIEKIKLYFNNSPPFSNFPGVMQNSPGLLSLTNPRFSHRWGPNYSLTRVSRR